MPSLTPSRIVLRHSNVSGEKPGNDDLLLGEVYINIPDNKLYYKNRDDLVNPIVEINLATTNDLIHVRDVNLSNDGELIATFSNNNTKSLGSVIGPDGRGLAIDGVVDYVNQLPTSSTIANILNKNGTLFIVRLGASSGSLFSPTGPRIYSYSTSGGGTWSELTGATVAASGANGTNGNTIRNGTASSPNNSDGNNGDYYLDNINYVLFGPKSAGVWPSTGVSLKGPNSITSSTTSDGTAALDIDSVETNDITIADAVTFNNETFNYGSGVASTHRTALGLGTAATTASTAYATASHSHGNITNAGAIGTTADQVVTTTTSGVLTTSSRSGIDSRSTFTPSSHVHGNITNAGAIGTTANRVIVTTTGGVLTTTSRDGIDTRTSFPNVNAVEYRLDTAPNQLEPADEGRVLLLQYGDSVWFKDNNDISILLAGSGDTPSGTYTLSESIIGGAYGEFNGSNSVTVPAGTYTVTISASNFITSGWGSHNINLKGTPNYGPLFSGDEISLGTLYLLQPNASNEDLSAQFALANPSGWPNQSGSISVAVSEETEFYLEGNLPASGDTVDITITFE